MPIGSSNIEEIIGSHSHRIANRMIEIAQWASSEEDVRYECNKLIDEFLSAAKIRIRGRHEYGLAGGRIDSKYAGVIIEYKDPTGSGRLTESLQSPGTKAAATQLKKRFADFQKHAHVDGNKLFGVATDGKHILFARTRASGVELDDPRPVTPYTVERFLRALVSLGASDKSYSPDQLAEDFASASQIAREGITNLIR
jgi:hypothetical protein